MQKYTVVILVALLLLGGGYVAWKYRDNTSSFDLSSERIAQDLDGKTANVAYGQVWPFDPTQNVSVRIIGKKQVDEYIVVVVELGAVAKVDQQKDNKLPAKVNLKGMAKLTYEKIGGEWYLVGVDGINLRGVPVN